MTTDKELECPLKQLQTFKKKNRHKNEEVLSQLHATQPVVL